MPRRHPFRAPMAASLTMLLQPSTVLINLGGINITISGTNFGASGVNITLNGVLLCPFLPGPPPSPGVSVNLAVVVRLLGLPLTPSPFQHLPHYLG